MDALPARLPELLLAWYPAHRRDLPWRRDREPYHVWLSEIMLQQTRVEAVRGYYLRFLQELPTIRALASCPDDRLNKLWEGLGYYSRVRNLKKAANVILQAHGGVFPREYDAIRALPGIGDYTAGAIASICFEQPVPAVDGNVLRVVSRVTANSAPVTKQSVRRDWAKALAAVCPAGRCGEMTQALMELGATVCVPNGEPLCAECPLRQICSAGAQGTWRQFPVKEAKKARREEELTVFFLRCGDRFAVRRRAETGLLAGLWELPNVPGLRSAQQALALLDEWGLQPQELEKSVEKTHLFTHVAWKMRCFYVTVREPGGALSWVGAERFAADIALPTAFRMFREEPDRDG